VEKNSFAVITNFSLLSILPADQKNPSIRD